MKAALSLALIFFSIWESEQMRCHLTEPDLYVCGYRADGDEVIYDYYDHTFFYQSNKEIFYPPRNEFSYYKITRIEFKDYGNDFHVNIGGEIDDYRISWEVVKENYGEYSFKLTIYGIYVGPCRKYQ